MEVGGSDGDGFSQRNAGRTLARRKNAAQGFAASMADSLGYGSLDESLCGVVPPPDAAAGAEVHAAEPAVDAAERNPVGPAGQHRAAGVGERDGAPQRM